MSNKKWSRGEIDILKTYYADEGEKVVDRLNRSKSAIRLQAHRLGLKVGGEQKPLKLLPCPFCGSEAEDGVEWTSQGSGCVDLLLYIQCKKPECRTRKTIVYQAAPSRFKDFDNARKKVVEKWNRRP